MACVGLVIGQLRGAHLSIRASAPLLSTAVTQQMQHKRGIVGKALREPGYSRPAPFPYKEKEYTFWRALLDDTTQRFDENSKIIVVDGPPTGNKDKFAKELADELDMFYIPGANMDSIYVNEYGFDRRTINHKLPQIFHSVDIEDFLRNPNRRATTRLQFHLMKIRFTQYQDAINHLLNTGQGVVMNRCIYSDPVFMNMLVDCGFSNANAREYYNECLQQGMVEYLRPHLLIYLDIPVEKIIENVKARNRPEELNSKVYTPEVLSTLELHYKNHLRNISEHSEVLIYDWSEEGDAEVVVEDVSRIDFDKYTRYDKKLKDWRFRDEWAWKEKRIKFSCMRYKFERWLNVPKLTVPEIVANGEERLDFDHIMAQTPGNKYAKGFNPDMGDKVLFKL